MASVPSNVVAIQSQPIIGNSEETKKGEDKPVVKDEPV